MEDLQLLRSSVERIRYLSDVYERIKLRLENCTKEEVESLTSQLEIAKKEILVLSYNLHKATANLKNE